MLVGRASQQEDKKLPGSILYCARQRAIGHLSDFRLRGPPQRQDPLRIVSKHLDCPPHFLRFASPFFRLLFHEGLTMNPPKIRPVQWILWSW